MALHLIPSHATIKNIKPGDERKRLTDGAGLYLLLCVKGGSHGWRFDCSIDGRRKTLSLGTYPTTSLSLARKQAEEARRLVRQGVDPSGNRKAERIERTRLRTVEKLAAAGLPPIDSFEAVAREW
jgi:Arm DNA-binding domain